MVEILVAFFLAFTVILVLTGFAEGGGRAAWFAAWPVFLLFFFAILAGGLWMTPVGPPLFGVYFVPFLLMALFVALFWASATPSPTWKRRAGAPPSDSTVQQDDRQVTAAGLGALFWMLLVGLAVVAFFGYAASTGVVARAS